MLIGLVVLVGLIGVVIPVVPGSLLIGSAVLVWAVVRGSAGPWVIFATVALLLVAGSVATYLLAGRRVAAAGIPGRSIMVAGLAGIAGFFLLPVVGLLLFFPAGLFAMEYLRLGDPTLAWRSAWLALKATALGMLVELGLALLAAGTWLVAVIAGVGG